MRLRIRRGATALGTAVLLGTLVAPTNRAGAGGPYSFYGVAPCRAVDTRNAAGPMGGPVLTANAGRSFPILGSCGLPLTATAVVFNVTIVTPTDLGDIRLYPAGIAAPLVSVLNWAVTDSAIANGATIPVTSGSGDNVSVFVDMLPGSTGTVHLVLDVTGYYQ